MITNYLRNRPKPHENENVNSSEIAADSDENVTDESSTEAAAGKRALSEGSVTSPDTNVAKKQRSELDDVAASLGENEPFWVPLIFKSLDVLHQKIDKSSSIQDLIVKKVNSLEVSVAFLSAKYDEQQATITKLEDDNKKLRDSFGNLFLQVDANEQHSRNECLLLHGVAESEDETPDVAVKKFVATANEKLGLDIKTSDIKRAHRLGRKPDDKTKSRPIIARFERMSVRNSVFLAKRKMKGTKMSFTENLTRFRLGKLNEARETHGHLNVWTMEGRVYAKNSDGNKITVKLHCI